MGRIVAAEVLAQNLKRLMAQHPTLKTGPKLAQRAGIAQKTINNIENARFDPKLSTIEALAKAFGISAYHLLCPAEDNDFLFIAKAYAQTDPRGKRLMTLAAESALSDDSGQKSA